MEIGKDILILKKQYTLLLLLMCKVVRCVGPERNILKWGSV